VKQEKDIHASFAFIPLIAKIMTSAHGKYLVKMENTLNDKIQLDTSSSCL
jgi:hypothetical protein